MGITTKTWFGSSTKLKSIDQGILLVVFLLMGIGLVQVYSASFIFATDTRGDGLFFLKRQIVFVALALGTLLSVAHLPINLIKRWAWVVWIGVGALLVLTLVPGFGSKAGGAHRWLNLAGLRFEPSELLKVFYPVFLAAILTRESKDRSRLFWLGAASAVLVPLFILLRQPDFGSFALCLAVLVSVLFASGLRLRYFVGGTVVGLPLFAFLLLGQGYRRARLQAFVDPWADPANSGFQVIQSLLSFYTGGVGGVGLGEGQGKLFFLPEAHTDFTLAVLGEEMGFVGILVLLLLYFYLVFRGFQVATKAKDRFLQLAATGLITLFSLQIFVNFGVAMGILPTKGLTLPFLSYGGSSLVASGILFGLLLNIERQTLDRRSL